MIFANVKRPQIAILRATIDAADKELTEIETQAASGCIRCANFSPGKGVCLKHGAAVPVDFQPHGCDEWTYDEIPF